MNDNGQAATGESQLVAVRIPTGLTLAGLIAGLLGGIVVARTGYADQALAIAGPIGTLWLRALQITIVPLVASLLVLGIARMAEAARAGDAARRMLSWVAIVLVGSSLVSALLLPPLLAMVPPPASATGVLATGAGAAQDVPSLAAFVESLVAPNIIAAAADNAMLPLTLFFAAFALALSRLPVGQRTQMLGLFGGIANAMLVMIGWVLWAAPVGVLALAMGVGAQSGGSAFATLAHYILTVSAMGLVILLGGYLLAALVGRVSPLRFARAILPAQAVALSTQSSLASLPAMLASARRLDIREATGDFVLPLAVGIFRATSPAMNMAVAIYIAHLAGVELTWAKLLLGAAVATVIAIGSVSLPGTISFVISVGPIALAMGVPIAPLALLSAVEMLPDIMRTIGNVTMDVALASAVDRNGRAVGEAMQPWRRSRIDVSNPIIPIHLREITMAFTVTPLPYADTALEPAISAETLSYHHGKHHKAYVDKTNASIEGTDLADADLEAVIAKARSGDKGLFNNAAQSWNHGFYWHSLAESGGSPSDELKSMIDDAFGSLDDLKKQLKEKGAGHFASGWVWLIEKGGKLEIGETHDGDTFADQDANPLLVIDLWEHAYYLDHQNARPAYLDAVIDGKLNWAFAADNLARGSTWKYPA